MPTRFSRFSFRKGKNMTEPIKPTVAPVPVKPEALKQSNVITIKQAGDMKTATFPAISWISDFVDAIKALFEHIQNIWSEVNGIKEIIAHAEKEAVEQEKIEEKEKLEQAKTTDETKQEILKIKTDLANLRILISPAIVFSEAFGKKLAEAADEVKSKATPKK